MSSARESERQALVRLLAEQLVRRHLEGQGALVPQLAQVQNHPATSNVVPIRRP